MLCLLILTSVFLGFLLAYTLWTRNFNYWDKKGVPSEKPSFPYGNVKPLFDAKETISDFFLSLIKKWPNSPLIGFYAFFKPMLLVSDPQLVKTVLVTDFHKFTDTNFTLSKNDEVLSRSSFWIKGHKQWKEKRSRFTSSFTSTKLKGMVPTMSSCFNRHIQSYWNGMIKNQDVPSLMLMDSIIRIALSIEVDLLKEKQTDKSDLNILMSADTFTSPNQHMSQVVSQFAPWLHKFLNLLVMSKESQAFFVKFVQSCVQERKKSKTERNDILQTLINNEKKGLSEGREGFDNIEWAANIMTVLVDSTETTGLVFSYIVYRLSLHLDEQEKLRNEILQISSSLADFDYDKLHSIKRLEMFINETLRLHPPLYSLFKICVETTKLGDVVVEKGTPVYIPITFFHWDPKYHKDPMTFDPERFADLHSMPNCSFFPFGEGPRACLGQRYAQTALRVLIVGYLLNFRISIKDNFDVKYSKQSPLLSLFEKTPEYVFHPLEEGKTVK